MAGRSLNFTSEGSTHSRNSSFLIGMDSLLRWVKKIFMNTNALPVYPFTPPLSYFPPSSVHSIYTNLFNISLDSKAADDVMKLSPPSLVGAASSWGMPNQVALHNDKSIRLPSFTSLRGRSRTLTKSSSQEYKSGLGADKTFTHVPETHQDVTKITS